MFEHMKAAVYKDVGKVEIKDVPEPKISPNEVLLHVKACAICGTDVRIFHYGHPKVTPPRILGHEVAGEVAMIGKDVKELSVGERVTVDPLIPCGKCYYCLQGIHNLCDDAKAIAYDFDGGFAEYLVIPEGAISSGCVVKLPEGLSYDEATVAEPLGCCINGQERAGVKLGETVAIMGVGPIGCLHLKLAKAKGAKVIIIEYNEARLKKAMELGADIAINPKNEDPIKRVLEETGGKGADVLIVACSSSVAQQQSPQMTAKRGKIIFFGGLPHEEPIINLNSNIVHYKEQDIMGSFSLTPYQFRKAVNLIASGIIDVKNIITDTFPLENIVDALKRAEEGLKIIIKI